ncbi:hypothetical protein Aple_074180 [Acrocarpospora pleiomorpha]|uniref:Uncharacterized protein n=2 Tax=Acrocarpospora pleiomorpha TaxID=90975 RepID=A0A5M3XWR9_9ACTN|nr:hypothetical protein Aple_074180 [Acrocarpospora pleiomorpha]
MWVEYDDGSHLSKSQKKPGEYSPLTREDKTNKLGHVTLSDIDEDDDDPQVVFVYHMESSPSSGPVAREEPSLSDHAIGLLGNLLIAGADAAADKARPHVTRWLAEQAAPTVMSTWNWLRSRRPGWPAGRAEQAAAAEPAPSTERQEVVAALQACQASMSTEEARNRFLAALVTRLYSEEQLRILREAQIEDVNGLLEVDSMVEALTVEQLRSAITALIEENPSLVGDGAQAELGKILDGGRPEAARIPLADEPSAEPLRTDRGM